MLLSRKILLIISIPIAFQIVVLVSLLALARQADRYREAESETAGSTAAIDHLSDLVVDASASVQGFVDTGDENRLGRYKNAIAEIEEELTFLERARAVEAEQRKESQIPDFFDFSGLRRTIRPILGDLMEQVNLTRAGHQEAAERERALRRHLVDAFQRQVDGNIREERQVEQEQANTGMVAQSRLRGFVLASIILSLGLVLPFSAVFLRSVARRLHVVSDNSERLARGVSLNEPVTGRDEVTILDRTFHEMANQIQRAKEVLKEERDFLAELEFKGAAQNVVLQNLIQEKNRFLGFAAHDLRGPLMAVLTSCTVLSRTPLQEKQQEVVQRIRNSVTSMSGLVDEFLDVATFSAGGLRITRADLGALVYESIDLHRQMADQKGLELVGPPDEAVWLPLDPEKISRVLNNLISNAIKFSAPPSRVTVEIQADSDRALISVRDHGPGIPVAEMSLLFQAFSRTSVQPTAGERSTGLGLAICRKIIDAHGGRIWAESVVGEGSTFRVSLPLEGAAEKIEGAQDVVPGHSELQPAAA